MSASSIVATPHCGACSFSDDLTSDVISATGCPQRFAPLGHRFLRSPRHARNDTVFGAVMFPITFPNVYGLGDFSATSIVASFPQSQWSQLHTVEFAPFRLTSPLTEFQPLAALRGSPWSALTARFSKDSRAHRGRNSRLAHRARQDSASFRLRRQRTALTFSSLPTQNPSDSLVEHNGVPYNVREDLYY